MDPKLNKVRKSISSRKKARGVTNSDSIQNQFSQFQVQEEEKHGYFPIFTDASSLQKRKSKMVSSFVFKGILSSILFLGTALLLQSTNDALENPKVVAKSLLTNEFPFAKVNQWYQQSFGTPVALTPSDNKVMTSEFNPMFALPVSGSIAESFQTNGEGVLISPSESSSISAIRQGVIIFAGNDPETSKTVVVQHPDGSTSTYGHLSAINVHLYQAVNSNQVIGNFVPSDSSSSVYFAVKKNDQFVDPLQVIEVDDQS
ncbi:peptidoglycan DD-metalloendopeptidase family protein [Virgibacillus sp. DJP39]|uniref:peptidoglycan DD-metalloendopeptidase family protein n=1 Tax=Virgibacillus sp. DJP39 TaxID=3409790 RepID=UPI003BB63178